MYKKMSGNELFNPIYVVKRNGNRQLADFSKVDKRLNMLNSKPTQLSCNASFVAQKVRDEITDGISTKILDEHSAKVSAELGAHNPEFLILAARIAVSNHHKNTSDCFSDTVELCYRNRTTTNKLAPRINAKFYKFVQYHKDALNKMVDYSRDFTFSYFGFTTLIDRYLIKRSGERKLVELRPQDFAIERPQDMWLRVACAIHMNRADLEDASILDDVCETYNLLSLGYIMHATPTLYNAGTNCENYLSCFLLGGDDSIKGIGKLISDSAEISKYSGGIGWWWDLRSAGSEVQTTNGISNGPIPFLRTQAANLRAVDQGGKRPGSGANYMDLAHPNFMEWVKLKRVGEVDGIDTLFYGAWVPDEFMRRLENNELWYFVDPHDQPLLYTLYDDEDMKWTEEYKRIIDAKLYKGDPIPARSIMKEICRTQGETGMPYMLFKDVCNARSNQKNIGVIKCSNLCCEILEYSSPEEYACCCVSSLCLPKFVVPCKCSPLETGHQLGCNGTMMVDYHELARCSGILVKNLNKIIDINFYPVPETERSNLRHRPLAVGVQGLADVFHLLHYPFTSPEARAENKRIFETIYYGCLVASNKLAMELGAYSTFYGDSLNNPTNPNELSPFAKGQFQFDMWGLRNEDLMGVWDWDSLRKSVIEYGVRNSLLTSLPPTASTSHIQGNNEAFEPYTDNIYIRNTLSGEHIIINQHLIRDLVELKLWNADLRSALIANRGSVQSINVPKHIKEQYLTAWEIDGPALVDMDADRAPFIDQTQSSNRFMKDPSEKKLIALHMRCWRKKLKTGMYYLRSQSASKAKQFSEAVKPKETPKDDVVCQLKKENGIMCYSCQ